MEKLMEQAKGLLGTQPAMLKTGVTALLGVMVVMMVLKPVAGQMVATMKEPLNLADGRAGSGESRGLPGGMRRPELDGAAGGGGLEAGGMGIDGEEQVATRFDEISNHIKRDPAHSTRLIEAWIASDGDD